MSDPHAPSDPNPASPEAAAPPDRPVTARAAGTTASLAEGGAAGPTPPKAPVAPRAPAPAPPPGGASKAAPSGQEITRRGFFSWLSVAWLAFTGASAIGLAQTARFMFPGIVVEPPLSFKAGFPQEYAPGVDERWKEKFGVWIVRDDSMGEIYALIAICTHLGCPPNWLPAEEKFKCPCHGSGYYMNGVNFEGPTPRPLERASISIGEDGQIIVDKGRVFQYEKGQWSDASSFLKA